MSEFVNYLFNNSADLMDIFLSKSYYHPDFMGSSYLKHIAKLTSPDIDYSIEEVKTGIQAELFFKENTAGNINLIPEQIKILDSYLTNDALAILNSFLFVRNKSYS